MTREAFRELVKKGPVLLDGATGTNLQKAGMPVGVCPEQWILENSEVLIDLQKQYVEAGTDILFAPTFTASRIKLRIWFGRSFRGDEPQACRTLKRGCKRYKCAGCRRSYHDRRTALSVGRSDV